MDVAAGPPPPKGFQQLSEASMAFSAHGAANLEMSDAQTAESWDENLRKCLPTRQGMVGANLGGISFTQFGVGHFRSLGSESRRT